MSLHDRESAEKILNKVIQFSKADECTASINGFSQGNSRFARNTVSTTGLINNTDLSVTVAFGPKIGTAVVNKFDNDSLRRVVKRAEEIALLTPENEEFMPAVEKQTYKPSSTFSESTAKITAESRADMAGRCIEACKKENLVSAGYLTDSQRFHSTANSKGNFGFQKSTSLDLTCTVRTQNGKGSGWTGRTGRSSS